MRPTQEQIDLFWSKVEKRGENECWPWLAGKKVDKEYGGFYFRQINNTIASHKIAFIIAHNFDFEDIPDSIIIRHSCNNPPCVNPLHLKMGTCKDNSQDMVNSGNSLKGSKNPKYIHISKDTINEMRKKYSKKIGIRQISKEYNVSYGYAYNIVKNRIHTDENYNPPDFNGAIKFGSDIVNNVREMKQRGVSVSHICVTFNISQSQVYNILRGDQRNNV